MGRVAVNNDLTQKYSKTSIVIHWLTAVLILTLYPLGKYMEDVLPSEKLGLIKIHAVLGTIVFLVTLFRSYLFFKSKRPEDLKTGSKINDKVAVWIHNTFYFFLILISILGLATMYTGGYIDAITLENSEMIMSKELITPLKAHGFLATLMIILVVLHVLGVVKHYVLTKENALKRMS